MNEAKWNEVTMPTAPMSALMAQCVREMREHGGYLTRQPGGFWVNPGFAHWFSTSTINALASRGKIWLSSPEGRTFPTRAEIRT